MEPIKSAFVRAWASWNGSLMFYTCLPLPRAWPLEFRWIARWAVGVGAVIGALLGAVDWGLMHLQVPVAVSSALVVMLAVALTGGLHLDGVMDVADGLAVPQAERRLAVMADSRMGAFGGMAAIALLLLKVIALTALVDHRLFILIATAMWGRWGQQWAIARYPYLKKEGKGALHQAALPTIYHTLPSLLMIGLLSGGVGAVGWVPGLLVWRTAMSGFMLAILTGAYFNRQLGGHTGDSYGAVVEWTEALLLCSLTAGSSY
ncbi:MAG: adenosylcobinamide-GDP ribazoletransferase [Phormidesmis sp.]